MKKSTLLKSLVLTSLIATAPTFASVIYSNSASFNSTLGSTVVDNYENPGYTFIQNNAQMNSVLNETQYQSTGFSNLNIVWGSSSNHAYCAGCNGSFLLDFTSTSVSGANGVFGVGFNFINQSNPLYSAIVTYGNGSTQTLSLGAASGGFASFWGITSDQLISNIHFGPADGSTSTAGSFAIDNLTIGNEGHPVPEASSLILMMLGLVGVVVSRRQKSV